MATLADQIAEEYGGLLRRAEIDPANNPVAFYPQTNVAFHVEIGTADKFDLISAERGLVVARSRLQGREELLFELVKLATFSEARRFELLNRKEGQDPRRLLFDRQITLMGRISSEWRERLSWELAQVLVRSPYRN